MESTARSCGLKGLQIEVVVRLGDAFEGIVGALISDQGMERPLSLIDQYIDEFISGPFFEILKERDSVVRLRQLAHFYRVTLTKEREVKGGMNVVRYFANNIEIAMGKDHERFRADHAAATRAFDRLVQLMDSSTDE